MVLRTAEELRSEAARFREMADFGHDIGLKLLLSLVADDFEQEAGSIDGCRKRTEPPNDAG